MAAGWIRQQPDRYRWRQPLNTVHSYPFQPAPLFNLLLTSYSSFLAPHGVPIFASIFEVPNPHVF
jgi:hypothetical protein